tara:strand:+ start:3197 stop:3790 length:594 start_codon:yes stop_codon:yes gene_type:complete
MSATLAPFGLKPVYHPSGLVRSLNYTGVYDTNAVFYSGTAVSLNNSGTASTLAVASNTPTANQRLAGVFGGVEYTDASGRRTVSKWFGPALGTATDVVMWVFMDPEIVYEIQATGSVASSAVGQEYDLLNNSSGQIIGNGGLGTSTASLDPTNVAAGTQAQLQVVGLGREITNAWGDANTIVQVKIANDRFVAANVE